MSKIGKLTVVNADNLLENHACGITNKRIQIIVLESDTSLES